MLLEHPSGVLRIDEVAGGRRRVTVERAVGFVPVSTCETAYPVPLIEHVLRVRGAASTPQEIGRDEDPVVVELPLRVDVLGYVDPADLAGRRVLDFGCGSGASTVVLSRLLPEAHLVGVELDGPKVELARARAAFHGVADRARFHVSPDPSRLPDGLGQVDAIVFSAVWEHLLPAERPAVLGLLWDHLAVGGMLFLDQTPHRWFPVDTHTTGLPFVPFLPDRLAGAAARRLSRRGHQGADWPELLRRGIRGGTAGEVLGVLRQAGHDATLMPPLDPDLHDSIDVWYRLSVAVRRHPAKRALRAALKALRATTGVEVPPTLALALRKVR